MTKQLDAADLLDAVQQVSLNESLAFATGDVHLDANGQKYLLVFECERELDVIVSIRKNSHYSMPSVIYLVDRSKLKELRITHGVRYGRFDHMALIVRSLGQYHFLHDLLKATDTFESKMEEAQIDFTIECKP